MLFSDLRAEREPCALAVEGALPAWLRGTYVRNGPARFDFPGEASVRHWFDGMAYLQRFHFDAGGVSLAARFVASRAYQTALEGRRPFDAFGTAASFSLKSYFGRLFGTTFTDNPNVNVARYGDRHVALTEVGLPRPFDPQTLETLAPYAFDDRLGTGYTTAHPAFARGRWINYTLKFGPVSRYIVWSMDERGTRTVLATIRTKRPSYVHSIGISERYAILIEYPYTVNPLALAFGRSPFVGAFRWNARGTSRFHLIDLRDGGVRTCEGEPFFSFHHVNAFDDGDAVVVDLVGYDDAGIVTDLAIANLREGGEVHTAGMSLRRYRLSPVKGTATRERIAPEPLRLELPRVNVRAGARAHFYYGPHFTQDGFATDALLRIDVRDGSVAAWQRPGEAPSEAVFVARPDASDEDDGVLLCAVRSADRDASALVVLDGRSFEEVARLWTGLPLPLGFHGQFYRPAQ